MEEGYHIDVAQKCSAHDSSAGIDNNIDENLKSATDSEAEGTTGKYQEIVTY